MIDPVAFYIWGWPVRWYGILISAAFLIGVFLASYLAKKRKVDPDTLWSILLIVVPAAIIGARLYYVLFNWSYYVDAPGEIIATWHGGLAVHGGILFGLLALIFSCRHYKENFWQIADLLVIPLVLGQSIGRWGNFFNQEAYGAVTDLPWAMLIDGEMRHPTFLYESLWDFLVFLVLLFFFKKSKKSGNVFLLYLVLYSVGRFMIEGFRTDSLMLGPLRAAQVVSLALIVLGSFFLYWQNRKAKTGQSRKAQARQNRGVRNEQARKAKAGKTKKRQSKEGPRKKRKTK